MLYVIRNTTINLAHVTRVYLINQEYTHSDNRQVYEYYKIHMSDGGALLITGKPESLEEGVPTYEAFMEAWSSYLTLVRFK